MIILFVLSMVDIIMCLVGLRYSIPTIVNSLQTRGFLIANGRNGLSKALNDFNIKTEISRLVSLTCWLIVGLGALEDVFFPAVPAWGFLWRLFMLIAIAAIVFNSINTDNIRIMINTMSDENYGRRMEDATEK